MLSLVTSSARRPLGPLVIHPADAICATYPPEQTTKLKVPTDEAVKLSKVPSCKRIVGRMFACFAYCQELCLSHFHLSDSIGFIFHRQLPPLRFSGDVCHEQ